MKKDYIDITAIGRRLKQEAKERKLSNTAMAYLLGYSDGHQISPFYSGKRALTDYQYKILSDAWGVRIPYLKCIDDFKTDKDILSYNDDIFSNEILSFIEYLRKLNYQVEIHYEPTAKEIYKQLDDKRKKQFAEIDDVKNALPKFGSIENILNYIDTDYYSNISINENRNSILNPPFNTEYFFIKSYEGKETQLSRADFLKFASAIKQNIKIIFDTFF